MADARVSQLCLGVKTFFARPKREPPRDGYESREKEEAENTPSPVNNIIHKFRRIKTIVHDNPYLCQYIDIVKGKHDRVLVVSEHYTISLRDEMKHHFHKNRRGLDEEKAGKYAFQILSGLSVLHEFGITHRNLSPTNILLDPQGHIKLTDVGLYECTRGGKHGADVDFPIGAPNYFSPETIAGGPAHDANSHPAADIWAVGMIILEILQGKILWEREGDDVDAILSKILYFCGHSPSGEDNNNGMQYGGDGSEGGPTNGKDGEFIKNKHAINSRHNLRLTEWLEDLQHANSLSEGFLEVLRMCLVVDPSKRGDVDNILRHPYFAPHHEREYGNKIWVQKPFMKSSMLDIDDTVVDNLVAYTDDPSRLPAESEKEKKPKKVHANGDHHKKEKGKGKGKGGHQKKKPEQSDPLVENSLSEIYHFWKLAGGDLETELPATLRLLPPILRLPLLVRLQPSGQAAVKNPMPYDDSITQISLESLRKRLGNKANKEAHHDSTQGGVVGAMVRKMMTKKGDYVPLDVRENDIDYQRYRLKIFKKLIEQVKDAQNDTPAPSMSTTPSTADAPKRRPPLNQKLVSVLRDIKQQAAIDIPPVIRADVWCLILGSQDYSESEIQRAYDVIDKESPGPWDRQIELDIPRCHQYHPLLSSPDGHRKLRRVLKAWVVANQNSLVYWQGLDSLLAPFLVLNYDNEARAFWCLQQLTTNYLHDFFLRENTIPLQEHLTIFYQLLAYHDPGLATHLHKNGFYPELYAIPWFLTLFTHIMPVQSVLRVWDRLLLGGSALSFFIAVSLMMQVRATLLSLDFNASILLFSQNSVTDMPNVDMESCVTTALRLFKETPPSLYTKKTVDSNASRWWEKPMPIASLKKHMAPRLSLEDLVSFSSPPVVLDIRSSTQFQRAHYGGAINVDPSDRDFTPLEQHKGQPVVVVAEKGKKGHKYANKLVRAHFPHVSELVGGIDVIVADAAALLET